MAEKPLDADFGNEPLDQPEQVLSKLNGNHVDLATSFVEQLYGSNSCAHDTTDLASIGTALDDLLAQAAVAAVESDPLRVKYQDTPIVSVAQSPAISTAHVTPQMSAVVLPPPPGFDLIDEGGETIDAASSPYMYYDQSCGLSYTSSPSWRPSYPPPFHLGFKLFVGALPYSVTEADLFPLFNQFGEILELHIQRDWLGRSKGCAWLRYSTMDECDAAIEALHNNYYLGSMNRPMQLTYASDSTNALERKGLSGSVSGGGSRGRTQSFSNGSTILTTAGSSTSETTPKLGASSDISVPTQRPRAMTDLGMPPPSTTSNEMTTTSTSGGLLSKLRMISQTTTASAAVVAAPSQGTDDQRCCLKIATGIPSSFSVDEMRKIFEQFGTIRSIESNTVVFDSIRDANRARDTINGVTLPGCSAAVSFL